LLFAPDKPKSEQVSKPDKKVKGDEPKEEIKIRLSDNSLLIEPKGSGDKPKIKKERYNRVEKKRNQAKLCKKKFKQKIDFVLQEKFGCIPHKKESCE
jgi:hypothetical protein